MNDDVQNIIPMITYVSYRLIMCDIIRPNILDALALYLLPFKVGIQGGDSTKAERIRC
jgi:hypothetical protein